MPIERSRYQGKYVGRHRFPEDAHFIINTCPDGSCPKAGVGQAVEKTFEFTMNVDGTNPRWVEDTTPRGTRTYVAIHVDELCKGWSDV